MQRTLSKRSNNSVYSIIRQGVDHLTIYAFFEMLTTRGSTWLGLFIVRWFARNEKLERWLTDRGLDIWGQSGRALARALLCC